MNSRKTDAAHIPHEKWDVFISHASEDKPFARKLTKALKKRGLRVWFDEDKLILGDPLRQSIDHGLKNSRFGIVILSKNYFADHKTWTVTELEGLIALETTPREKVILPIWHKITASEIKEFSPTLANRIAISSGVDIEQVVTAVIHAIEKASGSTLPSTLQNERRTGVATPSYAEIGQRLFSIVRSNWHVPGITALIIIMIIIYTALFLDSKTPDTITPTSTNLPIASPASPTNGAIALETDIPSPSPTRVTIYIPIQTVTPSPTPSNTSTNTPAVTNTSTPTPTATNTSTPMPTATDTSIPTPTNTSTPTPTATHTPAPAPTNTPDVPPGEFVLLKPTLSDEPTQGKVEFEWQWSSPLKANQGFEVRVWRDGEFPAGVHNAVENQHEIEPFDNNTYRLVADITDTPGVLRRNGEYNWTVLLIQIEPYQELGVQAEPGILKFEPVAPGPDGDGDGNKSPTVSP